MAARLVRAIASNGKIRAARQRGEQFDGQARAGLRHFSAVLACEPRPLRCALRALAELLGGAGERVGLLGESDPILAHNAAERIAAFIARMKPRLPDTRRLRRFTDTVLISDFLDPLGEIEAYLDTIVRSGARASMPVEV